MPPSNEWRKGGKSKLSIKRLSCRDLTFRGGGNRKLSKTFRKLGPLFHLFLAHTLFPLLVFIHVLNIFVSSPELFSSTGLLPPKKAPCCCSVSHVFDSRGGLGGACEGGIDLFKARHAPLPIRCVHNFGNGSQIQWLRRCKSLLLAA